QLHGAQHVLRVLDVDEAGEWESEDAHRLLTVDEGDDAASPLALELPDQALSTGVQQPLSQGGLQRGDEKEDPDQVERAHTAVIYDSSKPPRPGYRQPHRFCESRYCRCVSCAQAGSPAEVSRGDRRRVERTS